MRANEERRSAGEHRSAGDTREEAKMRTATIARPRASTPKRILILLNIRPGEGRRVAWMIVYSAAATGGMLTLSVATASTLFLSGLPVSATPFIFIASGISSVLVFLLYSLATGRVSGERLVVGTQVLLLSDRFGPVAPARHACGQQFCASARPVFVRGLRFHPDRHAVLGAGRGRSSTRGRRSACLG